MRHCCWRRITAQSARWSDTPSGALGRRFTTILAAEWWGVLGKICNSKRPFIFAHVFLMKKLGVRRDRDILDQITRRMDLWERGLHADLVGDAEEERAAREVWVASGSEEEDKTAARSYHNIV